MAKQLEQYTAKELGQMAKLRGIPGWHAMCKKALIEALSSQQNGKANSNASSKNGSGSETKKKKSTSSKSKSSNYNSNIEPELSARQIAASVNISFNENGLTGSSVPVPGTPGAPGFTPPSMLRKITTNSSVMDLNCELAQRSESDKKFTEQMKEEEDNLILRVRDAYWIQATWHIRQKTNDRVRGALGSDWHYAKPALRLFEVRPNDGFNSRRALRNIEVLLKAGNWFIDVNGIPTSYQVELGYITENGKFFTILTSDTVTTPSADTVKGFDAGFDFDEALDEYELKMNFKLQSSSDEERHVRQMIDDQRRKLGAAAFAKSVQFRRQGIPLPSGR